jgi:hypothetical protein
VSPGDSSQVATIAAISTSTLASIEAAQGLIDGDPEATVDRATENRALAVLSSVREKVKILDLDISHSSPSSEDEGGSKPFSASLESLVHLQRYVSVRTLPVSAC